MNWIPSNLPPPTPNDSIQRADVLAVLCQLFPPEIADLVLKFTNPFARVVTASCAPFYSQQSYPHRQPSATGMVPAVGIPILELSIQEDGVGAVELTFELERLDRVKVGRPEPVQLTKEVDLCPWFVLKVMKRVGRIATPGDVTFRYEPPFRYEPVTTGPSPPILDSSDADGDPYVKKETYWFRAKKRGEAGLWVGSLRKGDKIQLMPNFVHGRLPYGYRVVWAQLGVFAK